MPSDIILWARGEHPSPSPSPSLRTTVRGNELFSYNIRIGLRDPERNRAFVAIMSGSTRHGRQCQTAANAVYHYLRVLRLPSVTEDYLHPDNHANVAAWLTSQAAQAAFKARATPHSFVFWTHLHSFHYAVSQAALFDPNLVLDEADMLADGAKPHQIARMVGFRLLGEPA